MGLKDLLKRVVTGLTGGELEPPRRAPDEPIPTRSMAELYLEQGELDRAEAILRGLDTDDARARLHDVQRMRARERLGQLLADERPSSGVTVAREQGLCAIAWALDDDALARARLLVDGALVLRVTRIHADADGRVVRDEDDRPAEADGAEIVDAADGARVIASVGLKAGDEFVSVAYAAG